MKVGIIIPALRKKEITSLCVNSIYDNTDSKLFTLYLIDNDSTDNEPVADYFNDKFHNITYLVNMPPKNVTDSWNQGVEMALKDKCDYILVMNNDIVVGKDWLKVLVQTLKDNPDIWMLSPDAIQKEFIDYDFDKLSIERLTMPNDIQDRPGRFCFICPSITFKKIGLFDPNLHYFYGDDDYELRLRVAGKKGVYCRQVVIHHFESLTVNSRKKNDKKFRERLRQDAKYFGKKWQ